MVKNRMTYAEVEELRNSPQPYLLTTDELRRLIGVSHVTIKRWRDEGKLPYLNLGSTFRYPLDEILSLIKERKAKSE